MGLLPRSARWRELVAPYDRRALQAFDPVQVPLECRWPDLQRWCPAGPPAALPRLALACCDADVPAGTQAGPDANRQISPDAGTAASTQARKHGMRHATTQDRADASGPFPGDVPDLTRLLIQAAAWGLQLDGTRELLTRHSALARLTLRVRVKLQDMSAAINDRPHGTWDSGLVRDAPAAWQALAAFKPRRASFIVVYAASPLAGALQVLGARSPGFGWPVRVLVLGPGLDPAVALGQSGLPAGVTCQALAPPAVGYMPA